MERAVTDANEIGVPFEVGHLPFIGSVDWKDAMYGLALTGFDGVFNFEVSAGRMPASMCETFARYLVEAADELMAMTEGEKWKT